MLPQKLWIVWTVVFLAVMVSPAPVEEKEQEELEVEAIEGGEGELSEEEEDDDDSKSQDKNDEAGVAVQQDTSTALVPAGSAFSIHSAGGGLGDGTAGGSAGGGLGDGTAGGPAGVGPGDGTAGGSAGGGLGDGTAGGSAGGGLGDGTAGGSAGGGLGDGTAGGPAGGGLNDGTAGGSAGGGLGDGTAGGSAGGGLNDGTAGGSAGAESVDSSTYSNGQKLLNGGAGGGADSKTGVLGLFGGGVSHLDYTGSFDSSGHDFLLSLMSGGDPFGPGVYLNIPGSLTPPTQLDSTAVGEGVTPAQSAHLNSGSGPDSPAAHGYDISVDQSGPEHTSLSSEPEQSLTSSVSGSTHSAAQDGSLSSSIHGEPDRQQTGDSPDVNGNGRQTLLTEAQGAGETVTSLLNDPTAPGVLHDVTESPVFSFKSTMQTGDIPHSDLVTMVTESINTVSAPPAGTAMDSSFHPGVTDNTQTAGSVTEQYHPSGQGPEGAENVELEDTC
ncbi:uncharacterized protein LOC141802601 [Halichoeres trimaculatus]|uniref:uncharacterized protein LOC141802601 n=1 Tax=Halichoeres trimaculatus TaxID=147232 RepID=UPI003D9F5807